MAQKHLAIMDPDEQETFLYCRDTVQIHAVSVKFETPPYVVYPLKEFSLSDDAGIKCAPRVIYRYELDVNYILEIEFTTPVPRGNKYEISLYYTDKFRQLKFSYVLNAENIHQHNNTFRLPCKGAFIAGNNGKLANEIDGNIILCSKICRKDTLYLFQHRPALLNFSQITDCSLLFENAALSNLTISVNNREFKVHKEILAAKSSVFLAMFETEMKEKRENHVEIEDVDANIFQEFLRYIYTNKVNDLHLYAAKLYKVADKYDLSNLKMICVNELSRSLNVENAIRTFSFADENNETVLKETAMDFLKKNIKLIFKTEGYKALCQSPKAYYIIDEIFQATLDYIDALK